MNPRERLHAIYSPENFGNLSTGFTDRLKEYLSDCFSRPSPVTPLVSREKLFEMASRTLRSNTGDSFSKLCDDFLVHAHKIHSPHSMGHQVAPIVPVAGLFDALTSFTNQGLAVSEMGPFAMAAERAIISELCSLIGWDQKSDGIATGGGTIANLTAILAARNERYGEVWEKGIPSDYRPAIITSSESHYSISRAAGILGIGTHQVIQAPLDEKRRLAVDSLPQLLSNAKEKGLDVFCIVASCPSTPIGAFDELEPITKWAKANGIWCHVDGAHGASLLFSEKHKHLVSGIQGADSIVWDAHKLLFVPSLSTYVLFKDEKDSWGTFKQEASYLFSANESEERRFSGGLRTMECTKHGLSVSLWGIWSLYGRQLFSDLVDHTFANTVEFYEMLREEKDFETLHVPQSNIICFRYKGFSDQSVLRERLLKTGEFYITMTKLNGVPVLRLTLMNPMTERKHLVNLLESIRRVSRLP